MQCRTRGRAATALAAALLSGACSPSDNVARDTTIVVVGGEVAPALLPPAAPSSPAKVRVADITGSPSRFAGQFVTVEADVDEVLSPFAFELDEDSPLAGGIDNDLVVAYPKSLSLAELDNRWLNNKVRVTGAVRLFSIMELEREIGWDLSTKLEARFKDKPVLVATTVERLNRP